MAEAWSETQAQQGMVVSRCLQSSQSSEWSLSASCETLMPTHASSGLLRIAEAADSFVSV